MAQKTRFKCEVLKMGANRAMRRKQVREQMHEWVRMGKVEQMQRLTQQGISQKDLDECYDKGHKDGFKTGTDKTLRTVYAGVVLQLLEEGNTEDEAISFLRIFPHLLFKLS